MHRLSWFAATAILLLALLHVHALAHPVAQGSLDLKIEHTHVEAEFRVSNEQVFVQSSLGTPTAPAAPAGSLDDLWKAHAAYLLGHVFVQADGADLKGEVASVTPSQDVTIDGFVTYVLKYPLASAPSIVALRQNLLNEIPYAPGNPWEATFVTKVSRDGAPIQDALLFTHKEPLSIDLAAPQQGLWALAKSFFIHGMRHITEAWDHALFITALVLAVARFWPVVALVTTFTIAHTITLALVAAGWLPRPGGYVEPMIAGSIVIAALFNLFRTADAPLRPRIALAFGFGLFHGLGFAGDLAETMKTFSPDALFAAIGAFSIGVEVGHQAIVLPLLLVMALIRKFASSSVPIAARLGSGAVAVAGCYLLVGTLRP